MLLNWLTEVKVLQQGRDTFYITKIFICSLKNRTFAPL